VSADRSILIALSPLPLDSELAFRVVHNAEAGTFAGRSLRVELDNVSAAAAGLSLTDGTLGPNDDPTPLANHAVTYTKNKAWVAANLVPGVYEARLYVDDRFDSGVTFEAFLPAGRRH
jgi:hypothetical protein